MRRDLPSGTITFLFTDVEGSTALLHELGAEAYAAALAEHRRVVRAAVGENGGVEVDTQGDAFFVAFPTAPGALRAAAEIREALSPGPIRLRMGVHTGTPHVGDEGYVGIDVHRAARVAACGHGGQVLVSATTAALVERGALRDLGEHRLKDLSAPERLYQLGDGDFPPLKSLYQTNLPIPSTPFLGREHELNDVLALLARPDARLLTLTGPGGTGKTRLALQAAAEAAERYPAGVWWVPLAPLRDPELVLETTAQALGANDGLAEHVGDRRLLLLLDNFEHVVEAAPELGALLGTCPNLDVLVTSRELLAVPGEHAYPVPPLDERDGTDLFVAVARAAQPAFEPDEAVPELCARLEHLPLALELAAARIRVLSPEQLLGRLSRRLDLLKAGRGADPRQETLRATIDWSHELLDDDERRLFARLAVFAGGCTLEAAEELCDAELDTLQSLVDKSLVRVRDGDRFWMLETIREFAAERLEASREADELRARHARHFLALAEEAAPHARTYATDWLDRLDREHDNLRAALDRLEVEGETQLVLRLAGALSDFWGIRGHIAEGRRRLDGALARDDRSTAARARALNGAADLALAGADRATLIECAEEALELHRRLGDDWGAGESLLLLGHAAADERRFETARERWSESLRLFRSIGDTHYTMLSARLLAWAYADLGEVERAVELLQDVLAEARAAGHKDLQAQALEALAHHGAPRGRTDEAAVWLSEAHELNRELGDRFRRGIVVCRFARVLAFAGKADAAARVLASGERLNEEIGASSSGWLAQANDEARRMIRAHLDEADFARAWEEGRGLSADEAVTLALDALLQPPSAPREPQEAHDEGVEAEEIS